MIGISIEGLAAMLADAYREGWEQGRNLCPYDPEQTFLECLEQVEGMCGDEVRH